MNINIRAKDSFVHNDITMAKREERAVPEAQAKALIDGGLAEKVVERASNAAGRTQSTKRAPAAANKMAAAGSNKGAQSATQPAAGDPDDSGTATGDQAGDTASTGGAAGDAETSTGSAATSAAD